MYTENENPTGLSALTTLAADDVVIVGDTSDTSERVKKITKANFLTDLAATFAALVHTHTASQVTDFDAEVSNNTDVAANTAARHDAVTVSDTDDIDLTLSGQQVSASLKATAISAKTLDTLTGTEELLINDAGTLKKTTAQDIADLVAAGSGITRTVVVTSGSATMGSAAATDYFYSVVGAHTMSLPAAAGNTNRYTVKNNHSAAITVDTSGSETIDGTASISINPQSSVDIISDGTNFNIV